MSGVDLAIVAILAVSVIVSLFRGLIKEVFSVLVWVAAAVAAVQVAGPLAASLEPVIEMPSARIILAFVTVFVFVLVIGGLISHLIGQTIRRTGLSPTDRLFGAVFGLVRGGAIVLVAVILARFTPFPEEAWWQESQLLPVFERLAVWSMQYMPESVQAVMENGGPSKVESI